MTEDKDVGLKRVNKKTEEEKDLEKDIEKDMDKVDCRSKRCCQGIRSWAIIELLT